jgi:hypothetical protein
MLVRLQGGYSDGRVTGLGKAATITVMRRGKCSERGKKVLTWKAQRNITTEETQKETFGYLLSPNRGENLSCTSKPAFNEI